jgi:hypothetical protein
MSPASTAGHDNGRTTVVNVRGADAQAAGGFNQAPIDRRKTGAKRRTRTEVIEHRRDHHAGE